MTDPIPRELANWTPRGKEQNNEKQITYIIPWLFLPEIPKIKVKGGDAGTVPYLDLPQWARAVVAALGTTTKGTNDAYQTIHLQSLKEVVQVVKGSGCAKPKNYETKGYSLKKQFHFVDQYHQLPKLSLKWITCVRTKSVQSV